MIFSVRNFYVNDLIIFIYNSFQFIVIFDFFYNNLILTNFFDILSVYLKNQ
jgi:hypothetical protein